jgi:hypothetical protein
MKVCFNGCSFTVGEGFFESQRDQYIYDRLLTKQFGFDSTNVAISGSSNHTIFMRSAGEILSNKYDLVITQWTALNRIWLSPGPDTLFSVNNQVFPDYRYRDLSLSASEKKTFWNTLLLMNHDYNNIMELIDYCNILSALADTTSIKVIFVNGLVPWQKDLVCPLSNDLEQCLSEYTKSILDFDHRSDSEIVEFFTKLQTKFQNLDQSKWSNLFSSFLSATTDKGPQGHHPGPISHKWMADNISDYLIKNSML